MTLSSLAGANIVLLGLLASLAAGLMTSVGALPVLFGRRPSERARDGFGSGNIANGTSLAVGIGLQNAPEGLAVAVALTGEGYSRAHAFLVASLTGLVEPIGGLLGAGTVTISQPLLPWGLAFAAWAMLYVISHEIIPETHSRGFQKEATGGLMVGLVVMPFLDVTLG